MVFFLERSVNFAFDLLELDPIDGSYKYKIAYTNTFAKPPWFDHVAQEYAACRESIGLSDYSSFTKIDLWVSSMSSL